MDWSQQTWTTSGWTWEDEAEVPAIDINGENSGWTNDLGVESNHAYATESRAETLTGFGPKQAPEFRVGARLGLSAFLNVAGREVDIIESQLVATPTSRWRGVGRQPRKRGSLESHDASQWPEDEK